MEELDIPIFSKTYDLYKALHALRNTVPKIDRHALWQRIEQTTLHVIEHLLLAGQRSKEAKHTPLEQASVHLNLLRILIRLAKDTKSIDLKQYARIQQHIDEIGRMLGGWIKSIRSATPPPRGIFDDIRKRGRKCRREQEPTSSLALAFSLLTLSRSPFQFALTQLPSAVCTVPIPIRDTAD